MRPFTFFDMTCEASTLKRALYVLSRAAWHEISAAVGNRLDPIAFSQPSLLRSLRASLAVRQVS